MRKSLTLGVFASLVLASSLFVSCAGKGSNSGSVEVPDAPDAKFYHAMGFMNARQIGEEMPGEDKKMSVRYFIQGLQDWLDGKDAPSEEDLQKISEDFRKYAQDKALSDAKEKFKDHNEAGKKWYDEVTSGANIKTTESGLKYEVLSAGKGKTKITSNDTFHCKYSMCLHDGTEVDANEDAEFSPNWLVKGVQEGVKLMKQGDHFKIYLTPDEAYGWEDMGKIKPGSYLCFEIEVLSIEPEQKQN